MRTVAAVALALSVALASLCGAAASAASSEQMRVYLKQEADAWVAVERTPDGWVLARRPTEAPAVVAADVPQAGALFEPYVAIPVGSWPEAVAIGDLNGDQRNDVALVTSEYFDPVNDNSLFVFLQSASGTLLPATRYSVGASPRSVDVGDVNGDGRLDVVVGRYQAGLAVFLQNTSGTLDAPVPYATINAFKIRIGDFNGDGRKDVVGICWGSNGQQVDVFLQQPGGQLLLAQSLAGAHAGYDDLEVGRLDGDLSDDVLVMSGQGLAANLAVFGSSASGALLPPRFYDLGGNELTHGVGIGDLDGDARADLVASLGGNSPSAEIAVWTRGTYKYFAPPVRRASYDIPEPVEVADVSADSRADIVVAHGGWVRLGVYLQAADGSLGPEQLSSIPYASHYNPHGLAVGDINGDGAADVVIADYNNGLVLLRQTP